MKWFKCSNTLPLNPKMGIVADLSKSYKHEVIGVWVYLLSEASRNHNKGSLGKVDFDSIDYALGLIPKKAEKIYMALVIKGLITADNHIAGWVEYQADPTAAERQRKSRAAKQTMSQDVTVTNSDVTPCHDVTPEERRGEEIREDNNIPHQISFEYEVIAKNAGLNRNEMETEFILFQNNYIAKPNDTITTYTPLWQNWCINSKGKYAPNRKPNRQTNQYTKPSATESVIATAELIRSGKL